MNFRSLILALIPLTSVAAEDGKALYETFCSACHGVDGVGPEGNPNPPLAKSEWLLGSPDRAISAVMVGLKGPIEVTGKAYNLEMPPQGAIFKDEQLAAILSYVRQAWGNKGKAVQAAEVARIRAKLKDRKDAYSPGELLKEHPIPFSQGWPRLKNLKSYVYEGKWEVMPDFSKLEPVSVEEEPRNLVDSAHGEREKEFAVVWEGDLVTSKEGDYNAVIDASDGAILYINGNKIIEIEGVGPRGSERARIRRFRMLKGQNQFRLEYFNNQGNPGLSFKMQGPTGAPYLSESRLEIQPAAPSILLVPEKDGAVMYRHFITGARERAIGVGYDGGVNEAFGITHMGLDLIWQGDFIDGGLHWTNRGTGSQKPAGSEVVRLLEMPGYAAPESGTVPWPGRNENTTEFDFGGYSLDEKGIPTFRYEVEGIQATEISSFVKSGEDRSLVRKITFNAESEVPGNLQLALAAGPKIETLETGFRLDDVVTMTVENDGGLTARERKVKKHLVVVPLTLKQGTTTLTVTYTWN
ncbi:c-type cytochrome [Verrucomicrobiaceae bacterium 227]